MANLSLLPNSFSPASLAIGRAYAAHFWRPAKVQEWLDIVLAVLIWPAGVLFCALWVTLKNGRVVASRFGRSMIKQFGDQLKLTATSGLMPPWYYVFELYRPGAMSRARGFFTRGQTKYGAYQILAKARGSASPLSDKEAFARFCAERQVAAIPVLLSVRDGEVRGDVRSASDLPKCDLFVKPVCGRGGRGAERWDYAGGLYRGPEILNSIQFIERLREMSRVQPYLVQRRAENHSSIRNLSNGALNTIRMISCLDEHDRPEIVAAVLRMAVGRNVTVDNVHAGGLAAAIDLVEGRLGQATDMGIDAHLGWIDRHPDTNGRIAGRALPFWSEVCDLARHAHFAFRDWSVIGWDIAVMPGGPRLVEGNCGPDIDLVQRPLRKSFGDSRFGELLAFQLERFQGEHCRARTALAGAASPGSA